MSRFLKSFFACKLNQNTSRIHTSKKTLNFESLEVRRVMYGEACQAQLPAVVAPSESQVCTAMTLEEFIAQTGTTAEDGVVMKLPTEIGDHEIAQLDRLNLIHSSSKASAATGNSTPAKGDANSDGFVNEDDLAAWTANFTGDLGGNLASLAPAAKLFEEGDFDGDGDVDLNDLGEWAENHTGAVAPVDESAAAELEDATFALTALEDTSTSPVINPIAGDADADDDIDEQDLATWTANFTGDLGGSESATMTFAQGDFDRDGDVDLNDLGLWAENYTGVIEIVDQ